MKPTIGNDYICQIVYSKDLMEYKMPTIYPTKFIRKFANQLEIVVAVKDLLGAPTEAIVNPANSGLSHGSGLAAVIAEAAGEVLELDCERIINRFGKIPKTFAAPSKAGNLPYKCIIHAIGPRKGDENEEALLKQTIINAMMVAYKKKLKSIAFPALSTGIFGIEKEVCARAFLGALYKFWENNKHKEVNLVWICLTIDDFPYFEKIMNS